MCPIFMFERPICDNTFLMLAMKHYDNAQCVNLAEFEEDLKRFGYIKKLLVRYNDQDVLKTRLILNHIIVLYNLFGVITTDFLFFKVDKEHWHILATFLVYLNLMPESIPEMGVHLHKLQLDNKIIQELRKI